MLRRGAASKNHMAMAPNSVVVEATLAIYPFWVIWGVTKIDVVMLEAERGLGCYRGPFRVLYPEWHHGQASFAS